MNKNLLIFISHNFCVNCCGDKKKLDCDSRGVTCDKLANFLVSCNVYKEPIDEKKLDELTEKEMNIFFNVNTGEMHYCTVTEKEAFKAGYRKAME